MDIPELTKSFAGGEHAVSPSSDRADPRLIPVEAVSELVCIIEDGLVVYVNASGIRTLGAKSAAEIEGHPFVEFMTPDYKGLLADNFELMLAEQDPLPVKMIHFGGHDVEIELSIARISDSIEGRLVAMGRDITERRKATLEVLERERRISAIMNNVVDGIIAIDETGIIESLNRAAETIFGYPPQELLGCNVKILMGAADSERHDGYIAHHLRTGTGRAAKGTAVELVGRRKDGSTFPMEIAVSGMTTGVKRTFIGALRDITERKQHEEALRQSETRLRQIVDNAPMQIALSDSSGKYVLVNKSFAEAHGSEPDLINGKTVHEIVPEDVATTLATDNLKVLETGKVHEQEWLVPGMDDERHERVIRFPIPGPDGKPSGVGTIFSDVTEQKSLANQLRESEKLNDLGLLAGGVAHDFNNLLMIVGGYAKRALADPSDHDRVKDALAEIIVATDKAAALTNQLLAFSRRQVLETKVVQVAPLLDEMTNLLTPLLGATVTLSVEVADEQMCVETDPAHLSQILINLAINARDAMPGGGGLTIGAEVSKLEESLRRKHSEATFDTYVKFSVRDEGEGMDRETVARIFEPFFTTKEQGKGTGLGLSMVYGFVKQSKGIINVTSVPAEGTTVDVYLPFTDKAPEVQTVAAELGSGAGQGETILLAEDNDALLRIAKVTLEEAGYVVIAACDGMEALEMEDDHEGTIDLLLSDVVMPGLDGFELYRAIQETRPDIKVIFMSGYPTRGDSTTVEVPDDVTLLRKPLDMDTLAHKVRDMLDGKIGDQS